MRRGHVKIYLAKTSSRTLVAELEALGYGECTQPSEYPPKRRPWFLDNGAFAAWKAEAPFDEQSFMRVLCQALSDGAKPDFVVVPDIVAGGSESARFSLAWGRRLAGYQVPRYAVIQDGMTDEDMDAFWRARWVNGIFVGGTKEWKLKNGASLVQWAHRRGLPCHIGRVGTGRRVRWARQCGADSIDSAVPLWSRQNLNVFVREVEHPHLCWDGEE